MRMEQRSGRASWHARTNAIVVGYLGATVLALPIQAWGAAHGWLVIHLSLLGAVTNAIITWRRHTSPPPCSARRIA